MSAVPGDNTTVTKAPDQVQYEGAGPSAAAGKAAPYTKQ